MESPSSLKRPKTHVFQELLASGSFRCLSKRQVHYPRCIHMQLCRFGSDSFTQDSARLTERRKKEDEQCAWAAILVYSLKTSYSFINGIFMLRIIV